LGTSNFSLPHYFPIQSLSGELAAICIACFVLLCFSAHIGHSDSAGSEPWNLLANGHFTMGDVVPAGWSRSSKEGQDGNILRRDTEVAVGDPGYQGVPASVLIECKTPYKDSERQRRE